MSQTPDQNYQAFQLPVRLVTKLEVSRLVSEVEAVDNTLTSIAAHQKVGSDNYEQPAVSKNLEEFLQLNQITLQDSTQRSRLIHQLRQLKDNLPVIHITFASHADRESLHEIVAWLRNSVHQQAVVSVGLQPSLVAGAYIRTPNRVYDFSLKAILNNSHDTLVGHLEAARGEA